jgi:hypothetical protein
MRWTVPRPRALQVNGLGVLAVGAALLGGCGEAPPPEPLGHALESAVKHGVQARLHEGSVRAVESIWNSRNPAPPRGLSTEKATVSDVACWHEAGDEDGTCDVDVDVPGLQVHGVGVGSWLTVSVDCKDFEGRERCRWRIEEPWSQWK